MPARSANYSGGPTGDARTSEGPAPLTPTLALIDRWRPPCRSIASGSRSSASRWARRRRGSCCASGPASSPRRSRLPACRARIRPAPSAGDRIWVVHGNRDDTNPIRHDRAPPCRSLTPAQHALLGDRPARPRGAGDVAGRGPVRRLPAPAAAALVHRTSRSNQRPVCSPSPPSSASPWVASTPSSASSE